MAADNAVAAHQSAAPKPAVPVRPTADRISVSHGPYLIVAGRQPDRCAAVGYLGKKRVAASEAVSVDEAIAALKAMLDERTSDLKAGRTGDVPTEEEYREALEALYPTLSKRMQSMLATHCRQTRSATTLFDLARQFDVSEATVKLHYGKLARGLAKLLKFAPADEEVDRKLAPLLSIATVTTSATGNRAVLQLRPELVGALRSMHRVEA